MSRQWLLPEAFYNSLHRWPQFVAFFLVGCLFGWVSSRLWPASYRTTTEIYVGLNPYRAYSDSNFVALAKPKYSNLDDYKNWQMAQLKSVIFLDEFIQETLSRLQREDTYWESVQTSQLRHMLVDEWRTAGTWSLVAEGVDPIRTEQASRIWGEVVVERANEAIDAARSTFMIDDELQAVISQQAQASLHQSDLMATQQALRDWVSASANSPADQLLDPMERWRLLYMSARIAQFTPAWAALLKSQPAENEPLSAYIDWIGQVSTSIESDLPVLEQQINTLQSDRERLKNEYSQVAESSLGLSPNLEIKGLDHLPTETVRPAGLLILLGGMVGALVWLLVQFAQITREGPSL
jgi:hypothetical protein